MFCMNCGNQVPDDSAVCPYCRTPLARPVDAAPTGARKALPIVALCCGVVGTVVGSAGYIATWFDTVFSHSYATSLPSAPLPVILLSCLLGLAAIVCGVIGLVRSIRTGGKKYVTGIVLSAIGIYFGINALSTCLMFLIMNGMSGVFSQYSDFFFEF